MEAKDILQINVGIIAGAFIFLSLSITNLDQVERATIFHLDRQVFVAYLVIASFSSSSLVAIIAQWNKSKPAIYDRLIKVSLVLMITGFLILIGIALLVTLDIIRFID